MLAKIEKNFDRILPITSIITILLAFVIYENTLLVRYVFYDLSIGVGLFTLFLFRKQLAIRIKVISVIIAAELLGFVMVVDIGVSGTGITLIVIANVIAVAFLDFYKSIIFSTISVLFILGTGILTKLGFVNYVDNESYLMNNLIAWIVHAGTLAVLLISLHMVFWAIKNYLNENLVTLETSIEKTYNLAYYDQLTGLPNRYMFNEELLKRSEIHNVNGYLVLFDLKAFKLINSIYGSGLGDEILTKIAIIFTELKGDNEMVARISGNEYSWWMEGFNYKTLEYRLEYLKEEFYKRLRQLGITRKIEFHISYAHFPTNGDSIEAVYQKATMALGVAKKLNHSNVVKYDEKIEKTMRYNDHIRELLQEAIASKRFEMAYQEKVDTMTGKVIGLEALARWNKAEGGSISPAVFIKIIEGSNLANVFGNLIIETVLNEYGALQKIYGDGIKVSINISPSHMSTKGFKVFVMEAISKRGYDPSRFILEITEEVMIEDMDIIGEVLNPLRAYGVGISLDDFGTGFSSLNYLSQIDFTELKVDKSFIDQIGENTKIISLLRAIINLTNDYGITMIAEGVETKDQCDFLNDLGCYIIQGFYYSKPTYLRDMKKK